MAEAEGLIIHMKDPYVQAMGADDFRCPREAVYVLRLKKKKE